MAADRTKVKQEKDVRFCTFHCFEFVITFIVLFPPLFSLEKSSEEKENRRDVLMFADWCLEGMNSY